MRLARTLALSLGLLVIACGPPPHGEEPPHLLYSTDEQSLDNPFPDARLITANGVTLRPNWYRPFLMKGAVTAKVNAFFAGYAEAAKELNGFGNFAPTLVRVSDPIDPSSLSGVAVRLRKVGEKYEVLEANVAVEHSRDSLAGTGVTATEDYPEFLVVRPALPIWSGGDGLLVLKKGINTVDGRELGRGFEVEDDEGSMARISAAADALGIPEDDVLLALPIRTLAFNPNPVAHWTTLAPPPTVTIPAKGTLTPEFGGAIRVGAWTSTDPDWSTVAGPLARRVNPPKDVGQVILGTFTERDLREDGRWRQDWVADPLQAPEVQLPFVLTLPVGPRPEGGWKVVIGAHGLGGRNTLTTEADPQAFCIDIAEWLAAKGLGCLGIDAPSHGARGNVFDFFVLEDLRKTRDNFRQMAFDQMQLSRMAETIDLDGDGTPDLSPELGYFGNSLGGIMGGNFMALDPRVKYGVLNVPGGGLTNILTGPVIRDQLGLVLASKTGLVYRSAEYYSAFPLFRTIGQLFLEQGDPINSADELRKMPQRGILLQEGIGDRTVPNLTTENLAGAMGVSLVTSSIPGTSGTPIRALTHVDPAKYGKPADYNGHNVFWDIDAARTQVLDYLASGGTQLTVE